MSSSWLMLLVGVSRAVLVGPDDRVLEARVAGQLANSEWSVEAKVAPSPSPEEAEGVARALADGARAVIFLDWRPGGAELRLHDLLRQERWDRSLILPDDPSAAKEALALVIRGMLAELEPVEAAPPAAVAEVTAPEPKGWWLGIGWRSSIDGEAPSGRHALSLWLGRGFGPWALGLELELGLPARSVDPYTELTVSRHGVGVVGRYGAEQPGWDWGLSARATATGYQRVAEASVPNVSPTGKQLSVGAELGLNWVGRWAPEWAEGGGIELELGALTALGAPRFAYRVGAEVLDRSQLWALQPRAALALTWR